MHVFITGAATGIGEATIDAILQKMPSAGFTIADKNQQALQQVCQKLTRRGVHNHGIACDLTDIDGLPDVVKRAREQMGEVELLVNNAGMMLVDDLSRMPWERGKLMLDIHFTAPMKLIYEVLPAMLARGQGGIINVASMAGKALLAGCTWYGGSKAAMGHASEILYGEVKEKGVHVLTVYPGPISTELERGARQSYEENLVSRLMPVGGREELARLIVDAYLAKQPVLAYPAVYDVARHFHSLSGWLAQVFAPRTKSV